MATDKLIPTPIEDEMKNSYLAYAMSVIVARALPDARDGLKPVHRRILYAMREMGHTPDKAFKKSAATVGEVLKSFHPHGDQSVYDAMVRMAQPFNLRYPLIDGHGNFGSIDGDPPAAMRYTESRLAKIAMELLEDLDKDTVDWQPNFDDSTQEPRVLPAKLPNMLLNGSTGIAVGMATNIPPHNLGELVDGIVRLIDEPDVDPEELLEIIPAPDFPTGGLILGVEGARLAYRTGRGSVTMRSRTSIEEIRPGKHAIIVTEIPYQVNKTRLIEQIAELVKDKRIAGITDLRDESDRRGMRIVIELSRNEKPQVVLNNLYKHSQLQQNFGIINLALVNGEPRVLTLHDCLKIYLDHRREVVTRRSQYELNKARKRAHILEGLLKALDHLDAIITLIRASANPDEARSGLMARFEFSEEQANAILDMRLQRLTGLERNRLTEEFKQVSEYMAYLESLLADVARIMSVIRGELMEIREKYADPRRSEIVAGESGGFNRDDLIPPQEVIVSVSHAGYVKRQPTATYKTQKRGGRGVTGTGLKEEDWVEHIVVTNTHHYLMLITTRAKAYRLKGYDIPEAGRQSKGTALVNLLDIESDEKVMAVISVGDMSANAYIFMTTKLGYVKRTHLMEFANLRNRGILALTLEEGDELIGARVSPGDSQILLMTQKGMSIRFSETDVRPVGRGARGVRGIDLREGDSVVSMARIDRPDAELLVITEGGYGKRTPLSEFRLQKRGGLGLRSMRLEKAERGELVSARIVDPDEDIIICTQEGIVIRMALQGISEQGRGAQGVRLIRLAANDRVSSIAAVPKEEEEEVEVEVPESAVPELAAAREQEQAEAGAGAPPPLIDEDGLVKTDMLEASSDAGEPEAEPEE